MALLSTKLRSVAFDLRRERVGIAYWCPGCDGCHAICTKGDKSKGPLWSWDGSLDKPTISPSIKVTYNNECCHHFLRQGHIEYLADCTHPLAGKTVDLSDWPEDHDEAKFYLNSPHDFNMVAV